MRKLILFVSIALCFLIAPLAAEAGDFDGSRSLLLSVIRVVECTPDSACQETTPGNIGLPQFLKIDFTNKTISPGTAGDDRPATTIERQEVVDGKLILQGAEDGYEKMRDGLGWTMVISERSGHVVLTASGEQVAFVIFGACIPL